MKILILCSGNSCRSQMAHGFLQSFDKGLEVHSGGTEPATSISRRTIKVMAEVNIDISSHIPKHVEQYVNDEWDYVITVCDHANEICPAFTGKVKQRMHHGFEDPTHATGTDEFVLSGYLGSY